MTQSKTSEPTRRRLPKAQRRLELLEGARRIVREEGVDRLTLGRLAEYAGLSKPVIYDHFSTRSVLLIELYRWIDLEVVNAFRDTMASNPRGPDETTATLAEAYIRCASQTEGEFQAVGAALAGSEEKAVVFQTLLDNCVEMFIAVLKPHSPLSLPELQRLCIGLVGAGEGLAGLVLRGGCEEREAVDTFTRIIRLALQRL